MTPPAVPPDPTTWSSAPRDPDSVPRPSEVPAAPRFRRPDRPAPAAGDVRPLDAPLSPPSGDDALAPPSAGRGMEPLAALAAAFHANAMALQKSQEMQHDLGRALQRADRSEALLQSTGALNETFRGLTQVQRSLANRIDAGERDAASGRWFVPVLMLAALSIVGVGLYLVLRYVDQWRSDAMGVADIGTQLESQYRHGIEQGRSEVQTASDAKQRASDDRIKRLEDDVKALEVDRDAARTAAKDAQRSVEALQTEVTATRVDGMKARAIEEEAIRLRTEAMLRDPELDRARRELAEERNANAALRRRIADQSLGRAPAADEATPAAPPDPTAAAPTPPAAADASVSRERRDLDRARERLNGLFQVGSATRSDYLQVMKIGGVGAQRLTEVVFARYGAGGRVLNSLHAKDARFVHDRTRRVVEVVLSDGGIDYGGTSVPFPGGTFSTIVAEGDAVAAWRDSGLAFLATK